MTCVKKREVFKVKLLEAKCVLLTLTLTEQQQEAYGVCSQPLHTHYVSSVTEYGYVTPICPTQLTDSCAGFRV